MLLKKLTEASGLPGYEGEIRNIIKDEIKDFVSSMSVDRMGNLIAVKNEGNTDGKHIAISAHMDEVGLIVRGIDTGGLIRFSSWGVDPRVLVAKVVMIGDKKVPGVIGTKPIHLQKRGESKKALTLDDLYIDIGTASKEETEKLVSPGDYVAFVSEYTEFGDHKIKAKALDDRVGCAVLVEILKSDTPHKITAVFNTQEEVGLRGSMVSANQIFADLVINVEGTVCADMADTDPHKRVTILGKGPAISLIDRTSIYIKKYVDSFVKVANDNNIPFQYRATGNGGTDAGSFHTAHGGTPVIGVAAPCRYIHSPVSVMDKRDYENAILLIKTYIDWFNREGL